MTNPHSPPAQTAPRTQPSQGRRASDDERWHVSKTLPLALVVSLVTTVIGGIWAISAERTEAVIHFAEQDRRLDRLENSVDVQHRQINDLQRQISDRLSELSERSARIEVTLGIIVKQRQPGTN